MAGWGGSVIGPAYIAEVAPAAYRGRLGSFQQGAIVLGIALSQLVNYGILQIADGDQRGNIAGLEAWQWMLGVMVLPAILYGVLSLAIPESPRFWSPWAVRNAPEPCSPRSRNVRPPQRVEVQPFR